MASKKIEERKKTPIKRESFNFGEYVSPLPNPKPIPLGKFRPSPLVQYNISKITKTDSKHKQLTKPESKRHPQQKNAHNKAISHPKKNHTIKQKVGKHQKELQFLQSQLVSLQIENEKKKNDSSEQDVLEKRSRIAFDPSVQIMDAKPVDLTDKTSSIRSKADLTPYKAKSNNNNNQYNPYSNTSRCDYRITPIPQKRNRRVIFKANLQKIEDEIELNDKENIENTEIANKDILESPINNNLGKKELFTTPNNNNNKNESNDIAFNFNLGKKPVPLSATSSFLDSPKDLISNVSDPDSSHSTPEYMFSSNSASTAVTPILTPIKGTESNSKPFLFSWNKRK